MRRTRRKLTHTAVIWMRRRGSGRELVVNSRHVNPRQRVNTSAKSSPNSPKPLRKAQVFTPSLNCATLLGSGKYSIMGDVVTFKSLVGNNLTLEGRLQSVVMSDKPCHWDINFERASHAHVSSRGRSERGDHIRQAIDVAF
jgi:hypothetical protein